MVDLFDKTWVDAPTDNHVWSLSFRHGSSVLISPPFVQKQDGEIRNVHWVFVDGEKVDSLVYRV